MDNLNEKSSFSDNDIAVVGMAGRFPGAKNVEEFWQNLLKGKETISFFSEKELHEAGIHPAEYKHPQYIKAKGILEDIDCFDAAFFGYPPREAVRMDPQLRILHECSWEALEKAGYVPDSFPGTIGVYMGANENQEWLRRVKESGNGSPEEFDSFLLNYRDYISTRISFKLNLRGPSFTLLSACSTSLVAIHLACQAIKCGDCDMALAGGISLSLPRKRGYIFQEGLMVSSEGHCRTFDSRADGTVFGDGVGVVVLKSAAAARAAGDYIHAVVKGSAVNNDGNNKVGFTAPSVGGQTAVIRAAYKAAGIAPESISYIEAHGTATELGDPIEVEALTKAFASHKKGFCNIGSVKTNIGHINIAAGVSSFIKVVLSLENGIIPPSLHFDKPNPGLKLEQSPFAFSSELEPWETNGAPRRAGVSAFGFGGTNAHIVLEGSEQPDPTGGSRSRQLLVLSAKTASALERAAANLAVYLKSNRKIDLADVAYTLSVGRKHFACRRMLVCRNTADAPAMLRFSGPAGQVDVDDRPVIFMFPGQGAQYPRMAAELYQKEPVFKEKLDLCAEILKAHSEVDIRDIMFPSKGNTEAADVKLKQTTIAQPAIFALSYALAFLWMEWGIVPSGFIGHSIGEFTAACLAGVFSLEDALKIVALRGQFMQDLPAGVMLAVPLPEPEVAAYLNDEVSLAAVNAPSLCVLSGPREPVEKIRRELRGRGLGCQYLHTSHAFHSAMMHPVLQPFKAIIAEVDRNPPRQPIMSTVTGKWAAPDELTSPDYWAANLRNTVRFADGISALLADKDRSFLEVGPGRTLSSLLKMQENKVSQVPVYASLPSVRENRSDEEFILSTLGQLWLSGVKPDWRGFYRGYIRRRLPLPTYPFERQRFWLGAAKPEENALRQFVAMTKNPDISEWFYIPTWKSKPVPPQHPRRKEKPLRWLIFMDDIGLGAAVAKKLQAKKHSVIRVRSGQGYTKHDETNYTIAPDCLEDYESLLQEHKLGEPFNRILHLGSFSRIRNTELDQDRIDLAQDRGFISLLLLTQALGKLNYSGELSLFVISNNVHDVTGTELLQPEKASILGPVKVIPQEYPNVRCCNIDFDHEQKDTRDLDLLTGRILTEARALSTERIIAYRGDRRWVQIYESVKLDSSFQKKTKLRKGGVYLITGGLGGIGLVLAEFLSRKIKAKLILTGRSKLPDRQQWGSLLKTKPGDEELNRKIKSLQRIEKLGGQVFLIRSDVSDRKTMTAEIARAVKTLGPINGVIHAAGLPGEGILQLKTCATARKVLAPKIFGTLILADILKDMPLDFFFLCSSIARTLGGIGLGDYSAANSFLDAFAAYYSRRCQGLSVAVNWDMWGEVGMGLTTEMPDELKGWFEKELQNGISSQEGVAVFQRILSYGRNGNIVVSTRDLQVRLDLWIGRQFIQEKESLIDQKSDQPKYSRPNLTTSYVEPRSKTEKKIAKIWIGLFGVEQIGREDNFYELGGHSLLATTLLNKLRQEFETTISIRDVLDNPTVKELAALIEGS